MSRFRTHGVWVIICGLMLTLGLHGKAWGVYHLVRALTFFLH